MSGVATLKRSEWKNALDQLTADHEGQHVTIELLDPSVGYQHEAERLPFAYVPAQTRSLDADCWF